MLERGVVRGVPSGCWLPARARPHEVCQTIVQVCQ